MQSKKLVNGYTSISNMELKGGIQSSTQIVSPSESMNLFSPDRLQETVPGHEFSLTDIVHAIITNQPFSQRMELSDDQIKVVLYYAFMGRELITIAIQKEIMRTNVYYNYMQTGRMLREMADQGLVELEERIAQKSQHRYFLWKFTSYK